MAIVLGQSGLTGPVLVPAQEARMRSRSASAFQAPGMLMIWLGEVKVELQ